MRIVFYSTYSNKFNGNYISYAYRPRRMDEWDKLAEQYPEHEIILVLKFPGVYLLDIKGDEVQYKSDKIKYVFVEESGTAEDIAETIYELAPSLAVAISTPGMPFDWNPIQDSIIAEQLEKRGIKTIAHKVFTSIGAFDKWRSHLMLRELGFGVAKAVYVHNDLFWVEKADPTININVYKEYILYRVRDMTFPVIIKDTVGAGSLGIQIAQTYEQAEAMLTVEANDTDLIVEELVQGEQFGTEVHGVKGKYHVLPPFRFSINEAGITDPFQSVKFGPVTSKKYQIPQLQESLRRLAETLEFAGCAQIDLVFHNNKWYVIEINPRWSGMTTTASSAEGRSPLAVFMESALGSSVDYSSWDNLKYTLNFKTPELSDEDLDRLYAVPHVDYVMRMISTRPGMELKYCEVVFGGFDTKEELLAGLKSLSDSFPGVISPLVIENAGKLAQDD